jgi:hypothetical protein
MGKSGAETIRFMDTYPAREDPEFRGRDLRPAIAKAVRGGKSHPKFPVIGGPASILSSSLKIYFAGWGTA